jgi:hypothetical protein
VAHQQRYVAELWRCITSLAIDLAAAHTADRARRWQRHATELATLHPAAVIDRAAAHAPRCARHRQRHAAELCRCTKPR